MIIRRLRKEDLIDAARIRSISFHGRLNEEEAIRSFEKTTDEQLREHWGCFADDGDMMACIINNDFTVRFDGHLVKMGGIGGVATLPEYRMRGVAAAMLRRSETWLREKGIAAAVLKPDADIYGPFGYRPFGWHDLYRVEAAVLSEEMPAELFVPDAKHMLRCYEKFAKNYNGMMVRTEADMENILLEAKAAGGKVIAAPGAYGVLYEGKTEDSLSELAGDDILPFLAALSRAGKSLPRCDEGSICASSASCQPFRKNREKLCH